MANKKLDRLKEKPKDYTWDELTALLKSLGYEVRNGSGSRRKFIDDQKRKISLHEPHPNKIIKAYVIEQVLSTLEEHGKYD